MISTKLPVGTADDLLQWASQIMALGAAVTCAATNERDHVFLDHHGEQIGRMIETQAEAIHDTVDKYYKVFSSVGRAMENGGQMK